MANERKLNNYTVVGLDVGYLDDSVYDASFIEHVKARDDYHARQVAEAERESKGYEVAVFLAIFDGHLVSRV